jgi:hydrogenase-4 component F
MPIDIAFYAPLAAPLAVSLLALVLPMRVAAWATVLAAVSILGSGLALGLNTSDGSYGAGLLRVDALSSWMLLTIGGVATIACWSAAHQRERHHRRYLVLTQLFLACMCLAVLADNMGVLWVAVEATTIVTAFLVGHQRTRASVEAAWKYVVLCSIGIAIAFLGTVCVYAASVAAGADGIEALNWTYLSSHASTLDPGLMRLAIGLVLLGFGTKAGLVPMHAWLPDAHSQAPAAVSALMSGVLLSVAFYAILRYRTIADAVLGPAYARAYLLIGALASLALAAALLIAQRDYKRMLAYSSIEHMGLIALGAALGAKLALAAALLQILGHGLAKAIAFCASGRILEQFHTSTIDDVRGLGVRQPALAATFGVSLLALIGFPPFSIFASELGIVRAGFAAGYGWSIAIALVLVLIAFAAVVRHAGAMLLGPGATQPPAARMRGLGVLVIGLVAAAGLGVYLGPLNDLLRAAAVIAGGH